MTFESNYGNSFCQTGISYRICTAITVVDFQFVYKQRSFFNRDCDEITVHFGNFLLYVDCGHNFTSAFIKKMDQ